MSLPQFEVELDELVDELSEAVEELDAAGNPAGSPEARLFVGVRAAIAARDAEEPGT